MIDISQAVSRYFPTSITVIATSGTSTAFTAVNTGSFDQLYTFDCTEDCYVRVGSSAIGAATDQDWPLRAGVPQDFALKPGYGVRVIRVSADGVLKIGSTGV